VTTKNDLESTDPLTTTSPNSKKIVGGKKNIADWISRVLKQARSKNFSDKLPDIAPMEGRDFCVRREQSGGKQRLEEQRPVGNGTRLGTRVFNRSYFPRA